MPASDRIKLIVWTQAAGRCGFPGCGKELLLEGTSAGKPALIGEVAHIVAEQPDGPRGKSHLTLAQRNQPANLILLCPDHHTEIDKLPQTYTVERLGEFKSRHLEWVRRSLGSPRFPDEPVEDSLGQVSETVHSTLLPVTKLPKRVFRAPPRTTDPAEINRDMTWPAPYVLHERGILTFDDMRRRNSAFASLVNRRQVEMCDATTWWEDPDSHRLYVYLLGRCMNKITGQKGLMLDRKHKRYYFQSDEPGKPREVSYRPLNQNVTTAGAVWQPKRRRTGEPYGYWLHRAVRLRFFHIGEGKWVLAMRPEFHVTEDGAKDYDPNKIGARVTHKKSRMYNIDVLKEVNFWRDYLSGGTPRIAYRCGRQAIVIGTTLLQSVVLWPGIPDDLVPFRNVEYPETLFSAVEAEELLSDDVEDEADWLDEDEFLEDL